MSTLACPHCGTTNRSGSNFCNKCGTDLRDIVLPEEDLGETPPSIALAAERAAGFLDPASDEKVGTPGPGDVPGASEPLSAEIDEPTLADEPMEPPTEGVERSIRAGDTVDDIYQGPLFDLGLASPDALESGLPASQQNDDAIPNVAQTADRTAGTLLAPLSLLGGGEPGEELILEAQVPVDRDTRRWVEQVMRDEPVVVADPLAEGTPALSMRGDSLRRRWIFLLLLLAVLLPILFAWDGPSGEPHEWSGVDGAYETVNQLSSEDNVIIFWAYDPAEAGEMNLVVGPLLEHLIASQVNLSFVSPRPLGPATVERQVLATLENREIVADPQRVAQRLTAFNVFLPGGAAVLPLLAQDSVTPLDGGRYGAALWREMARPQFDVADLAIVIAADGEDVQHWLEMVQAINGVTTVAFTSAAADPLVRPYLDSRQLDGLVSGFDGAYHYQQFLERRPNSQEATQQQLQIVAQNWGHLAILAVLLLGNLVGLLFREGEDRP